MAYNRSMEIIETSVFTAFITTLMSDDDYKELQNSLIRCPVAGDIIKGSGGLRKLRWSASGRGKRGGSRVIYYWYKDQEIIYMLYAYAKNRQEDLTRDQLKVLSKLVEEEFK
ncbi:MAG: type II toxin-antitoxin system RelE/ParE family toxin [Candidatus Riflebacteria bacterium]